MANDPVIRFSVVIPVYHNAVTIAATLESVFAQTYPAFEVIVINDGGGVEMEQALLPFTDSIIYLPLLQNAGPSHARNAGMLKASGTHIAFLDADDCWHPDKLQVVAAALTLQPEIKFLFHDFTLQFTDQLPAAAQQRPERFSFAKLLLRNVIATPCVIIRRDAMLLFDETMRYTEDYDLFLRLAYTSGVYRLRVSLTQLGRPVLSAGGQSSNRRLMRSGEMKAYRHLVKLNPAFVLLVPVLYGWSALKYMVKAARL